MPNVGETIKAIRMQRGLSQFEVAAKSGLGLSAYQKAEQGQDRSDGGSIKIATLRKLAALYGMKPSDILKACGE